MIITNANWKGGTGKSTLCCYEAVRLADEGLKVLIIDIDPNCALSQIFGTTFKDVTSLEFLTGNWEEFKGIYNVMKNIDIIPSNLNNGLLNNIMDFSMKNAIKRSGLLKLYDVIIIDPPGFWGVHTRNAVFAADVLIIPGTCSRIDFEATKLFFTTLRRNCVEANTLICVNAYNEITNLPGIWEAYQKEFGDFLIEKPIPYISTFKRLTNDIHNYNVMTNIKNRLDFFISKIKSEGGYNA